MGKDRTSITNQLRLLKLPEPIKNDLREDRLSMGHARTLLAIDHLPTQLSLSQRTVKRRLSVRELERIVQNYKNKQQPAQVSPRQQDPEITALEKALSGHLSTKVVIRKNSSEAGKIELHFHSREALDRLLEVLGYSEDFS
jgi:ParB family chromosome partitioning protein